MSASLAPLADAFWSWIASSALPAAVLAALALALDAFRVPIALRAAPWVAVLARLLVPPGLVRELAPSFGATLAGDLEGGFAAAGAARMSAVLAPAAGPWREALAALWLAGAAAVLAATLLAHGRRVRGWLRGASAELSPELERLLEGCATRVGLARLPRVRLSRRVPSALVFGVLRPTLLLPAGACDPTRPETEHVLLHELAHLRHRDPLAASLTLAALALGWWHPAAWLAAARLARVRELRADRRAASLARGGSAGYRRTLLGHALPLLEGRLLSAFPGRLGGGPLLARLASLERPAGRPAAWERPCGALLLAALVAGAPGALDRGPLERAAGASSGDVAPGALHGPAPLVDERSEGPALELDPFSPEPGCLRRRFAVLAQLSARAAAPEGPASHHCQASPLGDPSR